MLHRLKAIADPSDRLTMNGQTRNGSENETGEITILTANLWHDWPRYRRLMERLERFAKVVEEEGVDVLLLQEVARTPEVRVDEWLGERLGMAYAYTRANGHESGIGFEEGPAVYTRFGLNNPRLRRLLPSAEPFARRLAISVEIDTPCGPLLAISVHLSPLPMQNGGQARFLRSWVKSLAGQQSALIGGDFNAHEDSSQIRHLVDGWIDLYRDSNPNNEGLTHEVKWPWGGYIFRRRADYIFFQRGDQLWRTVEARCLDEDLANFSDHRPVLVRLALCGEDEKIV